ncbi:MAG: hypothetical protein HYW07_06500 [Candidatus Latescibacteria bacterium]|nr:hypothetical protein [Candidatus Latescibacterota bacterium]
MSTPTKGEKRMSGAPIALTDENFAADRNSKQGGVIMAQITITYQENKRTTPGQFLKEFALANVAVVGLVCAAFLSASLPNTTTL